MKDSTGELRKHLEGMLVSKSRTPNTGPPKDGFHYRRSRSRSRKRSRKSAYDVVKIKDRSRKQSRKRDGIGFGRTRMFPFSSDSAYDSLVYDQVKTRLSELEAEGEG